MFSGFPYRSQASKESLHKITNVMTFWSVTRIVWGVSALILYIHDVDLLRPSQAGWSPIILFLLLVFCEIGPIIVLMDYSFMTMVGFANEATREMTSLPTGQHVLDGVNNQGNDEEVPAFGDNNESFHESTPEPLLGRDIS